MSREYEERGPEPADVRAMEQPAARGEMPTQLFQPDRAQDFRSRWDEIQIGFVDDPQRAVQRADELMGEMLKCITDTFGSQRSAIESQIAQGDTENLRMGLQRYRAFMQRLLSV